MSLNINYLVSRTEFKTMGFVPIGSVPADSNQIVTKAWADANYYVEANASPYSTYSSNRCPRYQDFIPAYNYWLADEYSCDGSGGCTLERTNVEVAFPPTFTPLRTRYYQPNFVDFAYKPVDPTTYSSSVNYIIMNTTAFVNCGLAACGAP